MALKVPNSCGLGKRRQADGSVAQREGMVCPRRAERSAMFVFEVVIDFSEDIQQTHNTCKHGMIHIDS